MKAGVNSTGAGSIIGCGFLAATLLATGLNASESNVHSLRSVETLALRAKALIEQVEHLKGQLKEAQDNNQELTSNVSRLEENLLKEQQKQQEQEKDNALLRKRIDQFDQLIRLFRSGAFEYYQVQEGDSIERIAANPMIFGDSSKAALIAQVNALKTETPLESGMVIIIPRFTEGVTYDF